MESVHPVASPATKSFHGGPVTLAALRHSIGALTDTSGPAIDTASDLAALGLDSIGIMKLASELRFSGVDVSFDELIERRTLEQWWSLIAARGAMPLTTEPLPPPLDPTAPFALSTMQHAYWMGRSAGRPLESGSHYYFEFDGADLGPRRLERAVRCLIQRHGMLRMRVLDDGQQQIMAQSAWPGLTLHDLRALPVEQRERSLEEIRERESSRRLAVERGQGVDFQLTLLPHSRTRLHVNVDMLVCDAVSFRLLFSELAALYGDPSSSFAPVTYDYPTYLRDARARKEEHRASARVFWNASLAEISGAPQLPLAMTPAMIEKPRVTRRELRITTDQWHILAVRARRHAVTLPMVLLTAYALVLAEWSTRRDFVVNLPLFQREPLHPDVQRMAGEFTGSILLAIEVPRARSFDVLAREVHSRFLVRVAHSAYSGVDVLRDLARIDPEAAQTAACVVFTSAIGLGDLFGEAAQRQFGSLGWMSSQTANVWLDCQVVELNGELLVNWDAVAQLFPPGMLDSMFEAFRALVAWLLDSEWDQAPPSLVPQRPLQIRDTMAPHVGARSDHLLHSGFLQNLGHYPDRLAIAWGDAGTMTYLQLGEQVRALARSLRALGVGVGDIVAITMPKQPGQAVAALAVLHLGAVYLPVSIDNPARRRERLYASAGARVVITDATCRVELQWPQSVTLIAVDDERAACPHLEATHVEPSALAYVMFTSGSTGEPKGVAVSHGAAMNTIEDLLERLQIGADDRVLSVSSLDFDLSVFDIFGLLSVGGTIVLPAEGERRDADRWVDLVQRWKVTIWQSVPALLDMWLVAAANREMQRCLRVVMLGGDWIGLDLPGRLQAVQPGCRFIALGGITETSIHMTFQEVFEVPAHWRSIPYGVPLANMKMRVVDESGYDRRDWVTGELWAGGAGLAQGYLNDPILTAQRFVETDTGRWYRSGDLARFWPDGTLEFLGRADSQVEIRGHRIELGEVRAAIEEHSEVSHAFVTVLQKPERRLAAAVVGAGITAERVRAFLDERLPHHLVPATILISPQLPLTANGKINRAEITRQLIDSVTGPERNAAPPEGPMEQLLAGLWTELLGVRPGTRIDSFFALGGDSLLATRLLVRLRDAGIEGFRIQDLFASPRLFEVASRLRSSGTPRVRIELAAHLEQAHEPFPLTEIQRAYWLGRQAHFVLGNVGSYWYWEFDGEDVDIGRLERALNRVIARHPMLRAVVDEDGQQRVLSKVPHFTISVTDAAAERESAALGEFRESLSHRIFDPTRWPLLEVSAKRYGQRRTRIGFGIDFLLVDALSIMILFSELAQLYQTPDNDLPCLDLTFRDYVLGVPRDPGERLAAQTFWSDRIAELPPAPQLPLALDPAELSRPRFVRRQMELSPTEWRALTAKARALGVTASAVLATAYAQVLSAWSAQRSLTLNFTLFDRAPVHEQVESIIGDFTSLMLVPWSHQAGESWAAAIARLQREVALGLQHRAVSALEVMGEIARRAGRTDLIMPVVFTSMLGVADNLVNLSMPFGKYVGGVSQTPQVWLDNQIVENEGRLLVNWDAAADLFPEGMLDAMFQAYGEVLRQLASAETDWTFDARVPLPSAQFNVRVAANATSAPTGTGLLHEAFFAHALAHPDRPALLWGETERLSYSELAQRALQLATALIDRGVRPGEPVAITLPKGPEQIVAVLGILAAGATYVPIGIDQPPARRAEMCANADVRVRLADLSCADGSVALKQPVASTSQSLAYIIYTSGSTGRPKGVAISHRSAVNTIEDVNERWAVTHEDRVLAVSALDFDLSVYDIFGPLSVGGAIVLIEECARRDAARWWQLVRTWGVTVWNSVPALLEMLATVAGDRPALSSLRLALVSGDWVPLGLCDRLQSFTERCPLIALGGATEAAIWSNFVEVVQVPAQWRSIPYGRPLRNQKFRVVNPWGQDCPDWVPGELWIGGLGVALGYVGDAVTSAERFVEHDGERWYRTGDLGRYWPDGQLEFLGRLDHQVKVRGYRIELGEIEASLEAHADVALAIATICGEGRSIAAGVVLRQGAGANAEALRAFLATQLPAYMLAQRIVFLEQTPLTPNGKLDRNAVARLADAESALEADVRPEGEIEETIARLWCELLHLERIGRGSTFFMLGGNSVLATEFVERARRRYGLEIGLRLLLEEPTVRQLAAALRALGASQAREPMEEGAV